MGIQLNPLGREGQPVISKNGRFIAIGKSNQIDIYDSSINLVRSVSVPGARPYGNYAVSGISDDASNIFIRSWNGYLSNGGGLHEVNATNGSISRIDVDENGSTVTYQGWSLDSQDIDFTSDYSKAVIAIRDTADSKSWGNQRVNIYVKNLSSGSLQRIDFVSTQSEMGFSSKPEISNDGQKVVFTSDLDLTATGASGQNLYLWKSGNSFELINKKKNGELFSSNYGWHADISGDGNKIVFQTHESLDPEDQNGTCDIYIKDLETGNFTRVSNDANNKGIYPRFSNDGKKVFYQVLYEGSWPDKYLKYYDLSTGHTGNIPNTGYTNQPHFSSESFESIANDSGILWTWKDYSNNDTDGDADYYYFSLEANPTYSIIPTVSSSNEGGEVRTNVSTSGVDAGTRLYWTISGKGIDANDFSSGDLKGSRLVKSDGSITFAHTLAADQTTEGTETLTIKLFSDWERTVQVGESAKVTINDTSIQQKSYYSIGDVQGYEGDTLYALVSRTGNVSTAHTLSLSASNQTAFAGSDFVAPSSTVSFAVGESSKLVSVRTIEDSLVESDESFTLSLSAISSGAEIKDGSATLSILNDDSNTTTNFYQTYNYIVNNSINYNVNVGNVNSGEGPFVNGESNNSVDSSAGMKTINVDYKFVGTGGSDVLQGYSGDNYGKDLLDGGEGDDQLKGYRGADFLNGGSGNDELRAGNGRDIITGGAGGDTMYGGFGLNTFENEADGAVDSLFFMSDQWAENWLYGKAGNSPNGEKADKITELDNFDRIYVQGVVTSQLTFKAVSHQSNLGETLSGIGIYASGYLEAMYVGDNLSLGQIEVMTQGLTSW